MSLPLLLWCEVVKHLPPTSYRVVRRVCKLWLAACDLVASCLAPGHAGNPALWSLFPGASTLNIRSLSHDEADALLQHLCSRLTHFLLPSDTTGHASASSSTNTWLKVIHAYDQRRNNESRLRGLTHVSPIEAVSCHNVGKAGIVVLQWLKHLRSLSITDLEPGYVPSIEDIKGIASLPELVDLSLVGFCALMDSHMQAVRHATGLTSLQLKDCSSMEDEGLLQLAKLTRLQQLDMSGTFTRASAMHMAALQQLHQLRSLSLTITSASVSSADVARVLRSLAGLTRLDISGSDAVDAQVLEAVASIRSLKSLGAAGLHPSAMDGLASLSALVHLQRLDLSWNMGLRCQQLHAAVTALTKLTALDCSWDRCLQAADLSFLTLLEGLQRLELPRLALTERPTLAALCRLQGLRVLDMSMHCFRFTTWPYLAQLTGLQELGLRRCEGAALAAGFSSITVLQELQRLDMSGCSVQEPQLLHLAELPDLRVLDLSHCSGAGDALMAALAAHQELRHLSVSRCSRVGPSGLLALGGSTSVRKVLVSSEMLLALPGAGVPWYLRLKPWWDYRRAATMVEAARGE